MTSDTEKQRELNDALRTTGIGKWRATDIVNDLSPAILTTIRRKIQTFSEWEPDDTLHNYGELEVLGQHIYWQIFYQDGDRELIVWHSNDYHTAPPR